MNKTTPKIALLACLVLALAASPAQLRAQITNATPAEKKTTAPSKDVSKGEKNAPSAKSDSGEKKRSGGGVHGKLAAVDKIAKTITLGKHSYLVTSETKIFKDGKPATLEEGVVGEPVSLGYKTGKDGQLIATKVTFGAKPEKKEDKK